MSWYQPWRDARLDDDIAVTVLVESCVNELRGRLETTRDRLAGRHRRMHRASPRPLSERIIGSSEEIGRGLRSRVSLLGRGRRPMRGLTRSRRQLRRACFGETCYPEVAQVQSPGKDTHLGFKGNRGPYGYGKSGWGNTGGKKRLEKGMAKGKARGKTNIRFYGQCYHCGDWATPPAT